MNILQGRPRGVQDAHLSLIQYLRNNAPGLVAVKTEVVTVEGGTLTFEQENLSLRVRRGKACIMQWGRLGLLPVLGYKKTAIGQRRRRSNANRTIRQ